MQVVTINLPEELYEQLLRTAALTQKSLDTIIAQSLAHSLLPLLEDIPAAYQSDVYPLLEMTDEALQQEVQRIFPANAWTDYEGLLQRKKEQPLTKSEQNRLDALRYQADLLTLRKGYAAVLLKRRGHRIPALPERPTAP